MAKLPLLERLRLKKRTPRSLEVGVAWYTADSWERIRNTATDPERFESTFEQWLVMAEDTLHNFVNAGVAPEKVMIDPEEFAASCKTRRKRNNAAARARFVSGKLRRDRGRVFSKEE